MIEQTYLVEDLLLQGPGNTLTHLEEHEVHFPDGINSMDIAGWYATDAETAAQALIDRQPAIISHFGYWVGKLH